MKTRILLIGIIIFSSLLISATNLWINREQNSKIEPDRFNLVMRIIGNQILQQIGDSTSRILPVKQLDPSTFQLEFQKPFSFVPDSVVKIIHKTLTINQLPNTYRVIVLNCEDKAIVYGYEMNPKIDNQIPCLGRDQAKACYKIQIVFLQNQTLNPLISNYLSFFLLLISIGLMISFWWQKTPQKPFAPNPEANFITLGKFTFYTQEGILKNQSETVELSEKENQLLQLLANQINQTITREELTKELWENQGVFVGGRTLDVFISKLRKKIQTDKSLKISNIHGKGYKLEQINEE
jgi:hypothetical protein